MSESKRTTNHDTIRKWAEERGGVPARIKDTGNSNGGGVLRIHFPKQSDDNENFEETSWDDFFSTFDNNNLDFLYQEKQESGEGSTFHKFVNRDS